MLRKNNVHKIGKIVTSCYNCNVAELCLPHNMDTAGIEKLDKIVRHPAPLHTGQHVFRAGDRFRSLFVIRSGMLKTYCNTEGGDERVLAFVLPGELVGLDGICAGRHESNSLALMTLSVCELPYDCLDELCRELPGLQEQMMRIVSNVISADQKSRLLFGRCNSEERLAGFLLNLSTRYKLCGLSATELYLPMSRQDIGNYLGLAIETVSRLFALFQEEDLLKVNRREITITDLSGLKGKVQGSPGSTSAAVS